MAICDDEMVHIDILRECITSAMDLIDEEYRITAFNSAAKLMASPTDYEILFLDLRLENGKDGISIGLALREKGYEQIIIIVTSLTHRTGDGYHAKALRFINKPVRQDEITEALRAAVYELKNNKDKIVIRFKGTTSFIPIQGITAIETYYGKRIVYAAQGKYETNERWEDIIARLPKNSFFCVNRSYCVHMRNVQSVHKTEIVMTDGMTIKFGRGKKKAFEQAFHAYIGGLRGDRLFASV